jgi:hypothetical protein
MGQSWGNPNPLDGIEGAVELTLAKALGLAAEAGRFDVVAQLARELEARRLGRLKNVALSDRDVRGHWRGSI